jgi:Tol biopolymer transport system component
LPPLTGRIVFSGLAAKDTFGSIFVMNADGSGLVKLTDSHGGDQPAWSPDGIRVVFLRSDGIWVMNADGSQPRRIHHLATMDDQWPVWSPDGKQIAFLEAPRCAPCSIGMTWALDVMKPDGSGLRKVTDTLSPERPAFSPDGASIVFSGQWSDPPTPANGLQSVRLDGTGLRQLTTGHDSSPAFSTDGRIAFLRDSAEAADGTILYSVVVANADGSAPHEVHLPFVGEAPLAWSPDGSRIALTGIASLPVVHMGQWDIWTIRPDGPGAMRLTNTPDLDEGFAAWH